MQFRNYSFEKPLAMSLWRKIAIASWSKNGVNPQSYASLSVDVTHLEEQISHNLKFKNLRMLHFMVAIIGRAQKKIPELNSILRLGRLYPKKNTDLIIQVAKNKQELGAVIIHNPHLLNPKQIQNKLDHEISKLREEGKKTLSTTHQLLLTFLPSIILRNILKLLGFLICIFNIPANLLAMKPGLFGSLRLNNLGPLELEDVVGPYAGWMRSPGSVILTKMKQENNKKLLKIWFVIDHRFTDASQAKIMKQHIQFYLNNPNDLWIEVE